VARQRNIDFRDWLGEFGLSKGTIDIYCRDVDLARTPAALLGRLRDDTLAPKTRRRILASARRWAEYTNNERFRDQLKRLRLPPPRRKAVKVPIAKEQLFALIDEIAKAADRSPRSPDHLNTPMRAVIGMMACRGFRCGDVLRLRRTELEDAKTTSILSYEAKGNRRLEFKLLKTYRKYLWQLADAGGDWDRVCDLIAPGGAMTLEKRMRAAAKAVERALSRLGVRAGITKLHPHRLRRTYAVEYLRSMSGDPEAMIKLTQHMQWASMATAMEYVDHARGAELDDVAERIFDRGDES
jgi:integrase